MLMTYFIVEELWGHDPSSFFCSMTKTYKEKIKLINVLKSTSEYISCHYTK